MRRIWMWSLLIVAVFGLAAGIGCGDEKKAENNPAREDPWEDYEPDPEVYTYEGEPSEVIEEPVGDGLTRRFPVDLFVFSLEEGVDRSAAEDVATAVEGELVGQIPDIRFYQVHLNSTTVPELDAAIETAAAQDGVEWADYDFMVEHRAEQACVADCDNLTLSDSEKCQFEDTRALEATYIVDQLEPLLDPQPVVLGIVDTGVNTGNGEFDDTRIVNAHRPGSSLDGLNDSHGHGTQVAGVMVADDGDGGVNGVASRILGDRVSLVSASAGTTAHHFLSAATHVVNAHAQVVNISYGYGFGVFTAPGANIHRKWEAFMKQHPDVLFVAAADNTPQTLTDWNDAPAGIQLPNVMTVGGTDHCDPLTPYADSARGGFIDIAAQAVEVTLVDPVQGRPVVTSVGNSFATPQVSAAAAVIRSLRPELSPSQIKSHLKSDGALPGPVEVGGMYLSVAGAMENMLVNEAGTAPEVLDILDPDRDQIAEMPGLVVGRLCGGLNYEIEGLGTFHVSELAEDATGLVTPQGTLLMSQPDQQRPALGLNLYGPFDLKTYPFVEVADYQSGLAEASVYYESISGGSGTALDGGEVQLLWCEIIERNPLDDNPMNVMIDGVFQGVFQYTVLEPQHSLEEKRFSGVFRMPFTVNGPDLEESVANMESECVGGKNR